MCISGDRGLQRTRTFTVAAIVLAAVLLVGVFAGPALAHVSQQVFVLILPTGAYTAAGVATVVLTIVALAFIPEGAAAGLFRSRRVIGAGPQIWQSITSLAALAVLAVVLYAGFAGSRDPLANPLPLFIWTVWWIGLLSLQALLGDVWSWFNPWTGAYRMVRGSLDADGLLKLPDRISSWPAVVVFALFASFMLANPAPDDPTRLAVIVAAYWGFTFVAMLVFGAGDWLERGECFTILFRHFATVSPFGRRGGDICIGMPGWQLIRGPALPLSGGVFVLLMLGVGSFDGLNETFWWLGVIDVNPLEFPGRSAIVTETAAGLAIANVVLISVFAACIHGGLALIGETARFGEAAGRLVVAVLPIAVGYHIAHYVTAIMVDGQYALAAANDPLSTGKSYLGLEHFHVTTGFFNSLDTVRAIWLTQAGAVVAGHVLSILAAHAIAVDLFGNNRKAAISQIPLAVLMIAYTFFGLWLLASPRGV